ncbi:MAG: hypothetical protein RL264_332 [Bacteroidota bacterium]|jgi:hypothetical protein
MRDELKSPKVENVAVAIVNTSAVGEEADYVVYLINLRDDIMEGIIVASTGFGENVHTGEKIKTSTLRRGIEVMLPNEAARIEPIMPDLFGLSNEFWVSFWVDEVLYDKKFLFPAGSIDVEKFTIIEPLGLPGVMMK